MHEKFLHVFEEEFHGIATRFRDEDYELLDEDKAFINEWIDYFKETIRSECVKKEDVKDLVNAIYILNKSPLEDSYDLSQRILYEIAYMKD